MGNGLLVAGALLGLQGVKTFFGQGRLRRRYWIALGLFELGLAFFLYVSPDINIRVLLVSVFMGTICFLIARELIVSAPAQVRFSSRLTAAVIGVYGGAMVIRGFVTPLWAPINEFFSPSSFQTAMVIVSIGAGLLSTFGFIIMNSERLEYELKVTGRLLEERESYLRTILDSVQAGVIVVDRGDPQVGPHEHPCRGPFGRPQEGHDRPDLPWTRLSGGGGRVPGH